MIASGLVQSDFTLRQQRLRFFGQLVPVGIFDDIPFLDEFLERDLFGAKPAAKGEQANTEIGSGAHKWPVVRFPVRPASGGRGRVGGAG